jgi:hypothetical protein
MSRSGPCWETERGNEFAPHPVATDQKGTILVGDRSFASYFGIAELPSEI